MWAALPCEYNWQVPESFKSERETNGNRVASKHLTFHRCERNRIPHGGRHHLPSFSTCVDYGAAGNCYLIFARMPSISSLRKARSV